MKGARQFCANSGFKSSLLPKFWGGFGDGREGLLTPTWVPACSLSLLLGWVGCCSERAAAGRICDRTHAVRIAWCYRDTTPESSLQDKKHKMSPPLWLYLAKKKNPKSSASTLVTSGGARISLLSIKILRLFLPFAQAARPSY